MNSIVKVVAVLAAAGLASVGLAACATDRPDSGSESLRIGVDASKLDNFGSPLDGLFVSYDYFVGRTVYETLLVRDSETGAYAPELAESYELADDRRHMTMELRQDVDFTDGVHFDAQSLIDYYDLLLASDGYFFASSLVDTYQLDTEAVGEYTVEFTTATSMDDAFFDFFLLNAGIASPEVAADRDALKAEINGGSGPYILEDLVAGVSAHFERNPDYRDPAAFDFDTIDISVFDDEVAIANALKSDQIDAGIFTATSQLPELEATGFELASSGGTYHGFVIQDIFGKLVPALADVRVRQAIAMAFDQESMVKAIDLGYASLSDQPFTPDQPFYQDGADDRYPFDPEGARALLAEAGYADGFELVIPSTDVSYYPADFEPAVQQSLADIGITVTFEPQVDASALETAWFGGEYPVLFCNMGASQTLTLTPASFAGDETWDRLTGVLATGTQSEFDAAASELGAYVIDQSWVVPLSFISAIRVAHKADIEVQMNPNTLFLGVSDFKRA